MKPFTTLNMLRNLNSLEIDLSYMLFEIRIEATK